MQANTQERAASQAEREAKLAISLLELATYSPELNCVAPDTSVEIASANVFEHDRLVAAVAKGRTRKEQREIARSIARASERAVKNYPAALSRDRKRQATDRDAIAFAAVKLPRVAPARATSRSKGSRPVRAPRREGGASSGSGDDGDGGGGGGDAVELRTGRIVNLADEPSCGAPSCPTGDALCRGPCPRGGYVHPSWRFSRFDGRDCWDWSDGGTIYHARGPAK